MLEVKKLLFLIENNIQSVIDENTPLGVDLWQLLIEQHPADIAMLIGKIDEEYQVSLFKKLPRDFSIDVFQKIPETVQALLLVQLDMDHAASILKDIIGN